MRVPIEQARVLSDLNLGAYLAHAARRAPGGAVAEGDGLVLYAGSHRNPGPYINGLFRLDAGVPPAEALERADAFFAPRKRGYAVWVRDHADADLEAEVRAAGFWQRPPAEGQPGIAIDRPIPPRQLDGVDIRRVADEQSARDFLHVVGDAWGMAGSPPELVWAQFLHPRALLAPEVGAFVVYVEGSMPAAASMNFVRHETAGLYWVARAQAARGRGLGAAAAIASLNAGFKMGARIAIAQSSMRGTPLWISLGFEVITRYRRYVVRPSAGPAARGLADELGGRPKGPPNVA